MYEDKRINILEQLVENKINYNSQLRIALNNTRKQVKDLLNENAELRQQLEDQDNYIKMCLL